MVGALCRAAFEGDTQRLTTLIQQWPRDKWIEKDSQGNTVSPR